MLVNNAGVDRPKPILEGRRRRHRPAGRREPARRAAPVPAGRARHGGARPRPRGQHPLDRRRLQLRRQLDLPRHQGGGEHAVAPAAHRRLRQARARHRDLPRPRRHRHLRPRARRRPKIRASASSTASSCRRPTDIADAIAFAIAAPVAVNIGHMEITPTLQVPGGLSTARPEQPRRQPRQRLRHGHEGLRPLGHPAEPRVRRDAAARRRR